MDKKCPYCENKMNTITEAGLTIGDYCIRCNHVSLTHYIEGPPGEECAVEYKQYNYDKASIQDLVLITATSLEEDY